MRAIAAELRAHASTQVISTSHPSAQVRGMWLLSTARAELQFVADPASVSGGYAILSHTWTNKEQSFQDLELVRQRCTESDENPRDHVSTKVRNCCVQAERYGYKWVWIDSCCIDKTNNAELSEAIDSMFRWYEHSEVCFAFLEDVPSHDDISAENSAFRRARYHTRGWTLQELLAPAVMIFVSDEWKRLGTKQELAPLLQDITGIPSHYLTRQSSFLDAPISMRMMWASRRNTTRVEDEAYCLLGLFGIKMPTVYGEGRQAFQRLQHEIVKRSLVNSDTTLFVWGKGVYGPHCDQYSPVSLSDMRKSFHGAIYTDRFLLAQSPKSFRLSEVNYTPVSSKEVLYDSPSLFGGIELPSFEVTNFGMKCHLPIAEIDGITIAVLSAISRRTYIGLILHPAENTELQLHDAVPRTYFVSWAFKSDTTCHLYRLAHLGGDPNNLSFRGKPIQATWRSIYIRDIPRHFENGADPALAVL